MPEPFDPYFELLGIDKQHRPPNHYALLGLNLFESDRKKIDEAATDRMSRLQDLANSEFVDHSQRLLNELSAARRCLLNDVQKVAYDEALRAKKQRAKLAGTKPTGKSSKKAKFRKQLFLIGIGIVTLLLIAVLLFSGGNQTPENFNLVLDWPLSERAGGTMLVDKVLQPLPSTDPMKIYVEEGQHSVVFRRPGFRDISQRISFTKKAVRLKLKWIPER